MLKYIYLLLRINKVLLIRYDVQEKTSIHFQQQNPKRIQITLIYHDEENEENPNLVVKEFNSDKLKGKYSLIIEKSK